MKKNNMVKRLICLFDYEMVFGSFAPISGDFHSTMLNDEVL